MAILPRLWFILKSDRYFMPWILDHLEDEVDNTPRVSSSPSLSSVLIMEKNKTQFVFQATQGR